MADQLASPGRQRDGHFCLRSRIQELWQHREAEERKKEGSAKAGEEGGGRDEIRNTAGGETGQESLNWAFEKLSVSLFPPVASGEVIEVQSDASVADAIHLLSRHGILSAPVRNVDAPADSSWIDRYLGLLDFAGIVLWVLGRASQIKARVRPGGRAVRGDEGAETANARTAEAVGDGEGGGEGEGERVEGTGEGGGEGSKVASAEAVAVAAAVGSGIGEKGLPPALSLGGDFFSLLLETAEFQTTKVSDVAGSFRWAPFLPVTPDDSLLTLLLLVSKYRLRSVPVVEAGQPTVLNLITQSSVVEVLADCRGLPWFDRLADRPIKELGLPTQSADKVVVVEDDAPVLEPFRRMLAAGVGGVPVVAKGTRQVVGSISVRDIQLLLVAPQLFGNRRSLTVSQFLEIAKGRGSSTGLLSPAANPPCRCRDSIPLHRLMQQLQAARVHRVYVTDEIGELEGVVTLRDIIGKFVVEPPDYFGDFFGGVVPDMHPTAAAPMWLHADWDIGGGW